MSFTSEIITVLLFVYDAMDFNSVFNKFFRDSSIFTRHSFFESDDLRNDRRDQDDTFYGDMQSFKDPINAFQQMEDVLNKLFSSSFPFGMLDFPKFSEDFQSEQSPRSIMLKDSDKRISDTFSIRKDIGEFGLSHHQDSEKEIFGMPHSFSYSKFLSIKRVHLPDGTVEEHKTIIDNDGKKTTTVRRSAGDAYHDVITESDEQRMFLKEKDNFLGIEQNDEIPHVENNKSKLSTSEIVEPSATASISLPTSSPLYLYLLKKFFGSSGTEVKSC